MKNGIINKICTAVQVYENWYWVPIDRFRSSGSITYHTRLGPKLICRCGDSDSGECAVIFSGKEYPLKLLDLDSMGTNPYVIDLGANVGAFAVWVSYWLGSLGLDSAKIICVEPDSENLQILKKNLAMNGLEAVQLYEGVVGSADGTAQISKSGKSDGIKMVKSGGTIVKQVTLEKLCSAHECTRIDLLKVDIEGAEYDVLEEAFDFVVKHVDKMIVEVHGAGNDAENMLWQLYEPYFELQSVSDNIIFFKNRTLQIDNV